MKVPIPADSASRNGHNPPEWALSRVELRLTPPFDAEAALGNLRAHAIPGVEVVDGSSITRIVSAASGPLAVTVTLAPDAVTASFAAGNAADAESVTRVIRRWFDLDLDPAQVAAVLGTDPVIGPLIARRPGLRVIGAPNPFETAVMTILGQQVSLAAARTFGGRLVAAFGESGPAALIAFPTPAALADATPEALQGAVGLTGARSRTLHGVASAFAGGLTLEPAGDFAETRARLLALPGVGPWTADYLAVRVLGDRDAFTASDLVLRRALGGVSAKAAEAASEAWRPWRAYALFHLWTSTSY